MNFALSVIAKTTILLACASLMTLALRRASASAKHAVWAIALLSALILPIASRFLPEVALPVLPEETFQAATPLLITGAAESRSRLQTPQSDPEDIYPRPPALRRQLGHRSPQPRRIKGPVSVRSCEARLFRFSGRWVQALSCFASYWALSQFADSGGIPFALKVLNGPIFWTI